MPHLCTLNNIVRFWVVFLGYFCYLDACRDGSIRKHGEESNDMEKASVNLNDYQLIGAAVKTIRGGILVGQINLLAVSTITYQKVLFGPYGARESIGEERSNIIVGAIQAFYGHSEAALDEIGFMGKKIVL